MVAVFRADALRVDPAGTLEGTVVDCRVGPYGTVLVLELGGELFESLARGGPMPIAGSRTRVALDVDQVHLFAGAADVR